MFETASTTARVALIAYGLVLKQRFQVWDAVSFCALRTAGAGLLLSEDLQNRWQIDGMRVINPFGLSDEAMGELLQGS